MIWIWIIAAVLLSMWSCRGSEIKYYHYVWLLLPIEMYGISIAGALLKPYMIYGLFVILMEVMRKKRICLPSSLLLISFALIMTDCANGMHVDSIMQHFMYIFVALIAVYYVQASDFCIDLGCVSKLTRSLVLGYGCIFAIAFIVYLFKPAFPNMVTANRVSPGLFLQQYGAGGSVSIRFRGFTLDPNSAIAPFFPGYCFALHELYTRRKERTRNILILMVFWIVVFISNSRGALLCSLMLSTIITVDRFIAARDKSKWLISFVGIVFAIVLFAVVSNRNVFRLLGDTLYDYMNQRAGLTDEAGRLTIWTKNLNALFESGNWAFGVGQNRIQFYTLEGKHCHNTWIEWICGSGIFVGTAIVLWHLFAPLKSYLRLRNGTGKKQTGELLLAYYSIFVCVAFIDNITNATMVFLIFLLTMCTRVKACET